MSDRAVELFTRFLEERDAGREPDPADLIAEAGDDAEALSGMLTAYLATHPATSFSDEDVLAAARRPELAPPQPWTELLPDLRARAHTTRGDLVRRLAAQLGVAGCEPQVAGYVHELETGQRSPMAVRPAVVRALAAVLGVPAALLEAGRGLPAAPSAPAVAVFARPGPEPDGDPLTLLADEPAPDARVDDLFGGGPDG